MGFDYDKLRKSEEESGTQWASYSDLFMMLSVVFLFLYVSASLRSGTSGIQNQLEFQRLSQENQDLRQQIKVYSALKDNYLETQASQNEAKVYEDLMARLTLLQDKATEEKNQLQRQAKENEQKAEALNQYQQIIRNIINTNYIAKARIKKRDTIIEEKDKSLSESLTEISQLKEDVDQKRAQLKEREQEIAKVSRQVNVKVDEIKRLYNQQKITKKKMEEQIEQLTAQSAAKVAQLKEQTQTITAQLSNVQAKLQDVNSQLTATTDTLQKELAQKAQLVAKVQEDRKAYQAQLNELRQDHRDRMARERREFEAQLAKEKLSAQQKLQRQRDFQEQAEAKAAELANKVGDLNQKIADTTARLEKAKAAANARKVLAAKIQNNFSKAGIKADVNPETGDVILSFGKEYFDTGSAQLKQGMRETLEKSIPIYAKSLFQDEKISQKLKNVEIVGFASPTYKGKYVDPNSLDGRDKAAVNFNLDLSFSRAKSIFNHIFDTNKMTYENQERLLPLVKVTGRSFLASATKGRDVASGIGLKEFCEKYNCKEAQKVIIRFDISD